ncbi:unnamed protein product, partial [Diamesa hyperborea]
MEILRQTKQTTSDTLHEISVHGFVFLVKRGTSIIERLIWMVCIIVGIYGIINLGQNIWNRYQTSPTVISMDRNKFSWNTSFPSLTVCPDRRIDENKLTEYINNHPEKFNNESDKVDFRMFINRLSKLTYETMNTFPTDRDFGIKSEEYLDIVWDLKWDFNPEISSGTSNKLYMYYTITEYGICNAVNSRIAPYNSYQYWKENRWDILKTNITGEIYAQLTNLSTSYEVFFHGAMEIPDISKQHQNFPETDYTTVEFLALEILTSDDAKKLSISQRKCRLETESKLSTSSIYSFNICRSECRFKMVYKECKCIPYFYRNQDKYGKKYPICGLEGIKCMANISAELVSLQSKTRKIDCNCESNCDNTNFFIQSIRSRVWFLGANLQWGIIDYPKLQLKRELLFGLSDVLVYVGGLGGLFLGCSLLGFAELLFFFTWGLVK